MAKKIGIAFIVLLIIVVVVKFDSIRNLFRANNRTVNSKEVKFILREEPNLTQLATELKLNGIIESEQKLIDFAVNNELDTSSFAAGKYIVLSGTTFSDLLHGFQKNEDGEGYSEVKVKVVFNRCVDVHDIGSNISKCIQADSTSLVNAILSKKTLEKYGFTEAQIPALFIPREYEMYFDTDAKEFIAIMAREFKNYWSEERKQKLTKIGLSSPSQAVTLASIVYSEQSQISEEWPLIAGLYLNRINKGMKLQSDPTFKFCWEDRLEGVERLLNMHKNKDCPYNTYLYAGLPPGPICIPPASVIDAVLNPADVDYLYMCGKPGGGGHNFAVNLTGHEQNVSAYRKWLRNYLKNKQS